MTITLNIHNEQLFDKILQFLNRFKNDGLEIMTQYKENKQPNITPHKKKLPKGFFNPVQIDSYTDIVSRDALHER